MRENVADGGTVKGRGAGRRALQGYQVIPGATPPEDESPHKVRPAAAGRMTVASRLHIGPLPWSVRPPQGQAGRGVPASGDDAPGYCLHPLQGFAPEQDGDSSGSISQALSAIDRLSGGLTTSPVSGLHGKVTADVGGGAARSLEWFSSRRPAMRDVGSCQQAQTEWGSGPIEGMRVHWRLVATDSAFLSVGFSVQDSGGRPNDATTTPAGRCGTREQFSSAC